MRLARNRKVQAAAHDDANVAFLVAQSLPERQVLEVKVRRKSEEDEVVKRRKLKEQVARAMPPDDECLFLSTARLHHCRNGPWVACGDGHGDAASAQRLWQGPLRDAQSCGQS